MAKYEIVIKTPDGGFRRVWTKTLITKNVKMENDELIIKSSAYPPNDLKDANITKVYAEPITGPAECFWCGERMVRLQDGQSVCPQCGWRI